MNLFLPVRHLIKFFTLAVLLLILSACTTFHEVNVNGYLGKKHIAIEGKKIYVHRDIQAENPLLENEIIVKVKNALKIKGYKPVDNLTDSDYVLLVLYDSKGRTEMYTAPDYTLDPYSNQFEQATFQYTQEVFRQRLILNLYQSKVIMKNFKPVWRGEIYSESDSSDFREVINALIVVGFEHFGEDTQSEKQYKIFSRDRRLEALNQLSVGELDTGKLDLKEKHTPK